MVVKKIVETQEIVTEENKVKRNVPGKRYAITFDSRTTALIKKYAEEEGVSMAEVIRRALNFYQLKRMVDQPNRFIEVVEVDEEGNEKRRYRILTV